METLFSTLTLLLGEVYVDPTTLCGTYSQNGGTYMNFNQ